MLDTGNKTIDMFIDFAKSFDTIDHKVLFKYFIRSWNKQSKSLLSYLKENSNEYVK